MKSIFSTTSTYWQIPLRFCLFFVFWMHGSQKVLGMYHGPGLAGWTQYMAGAGIPAAIAYIAAFAEFLGCFSMAFGFMTRLGALGITIQMLVAMVMVHWKNGFFLNWTGEPGRGHGYEYSMTLMLMALALLIGGAGNLSVDKGLAKKGGRKSGRAS